MQAAPCFTLATHSFLWRNDEESKGRTNMSNASFVSASALRSAVIPSAHTTNKPSTWHTAKPAFYAAFYAGYEATWGSTR